MYTGYVEQSWVVSEDAVLRVMYGGRVMATVQGTNGDYLVKLPVGKYSCVATAKGFMAYYSQDCVVQVINMPLFPRA